MAKSVHCLDIARYSFSLLTAGPHPVSLDGSLFEGFPDRQVPVDEVRDRLLDHACPPATKDAVWAGLVRRSRAEGSTWTVVAVGVALPALFAVASQVEAQSPEDCDVHAGVLDGFLDALRTVDLGAPRVLARLRRAALRAGHRACRESRETPVPLRSELLQQSASPEWGHPDLVLARAVADRVLSGDEADLIGATRLEHRSVVDWARSRRADVRAAYRSRARAERRLVSYLRDQIDEVSRCA
ncbi:hypothetical protein JNUCC0626_13795 [Lentzea sp. JNUCC 0626]|uniref:hypothetical protein n=1 Tax=Lentzea sp. JNUCC 0626 TaxID=3367513 RepID=UPI00374882E7